MARGGRGRARGAGPAGWGGAGRMGRPLGARLVGPGDSGGCGARGPAAARDGCGRPRRAPEGLRRRRPRPGGGASPGRRGSSRRTGAGRLRGAGAGPARAGYDDPAAGPRIASPPPPPRGGPSSRLRTRHTGGEWPRRGGRWAGSGLRSAPRGGRARRGSGRRPAGREGGRVSGEPPPGPARPAAEGPCPGTAGELRARPRQLPRPAPPPGRLLSSDDRGRRPPGGGGGGPCGAGARVPLRAECDPGAGWARRVGGGAWKLPAPRRWAFAVGLAAREDGAAAWGPPGEGAPVPAGCGVRLGGKLWPCAVTFPGLSLQGGGGRRERPGLPGAAAPSPRLREGGRERLATGAGGRGEAAGRPGAACVRAGRALLPGGREGRTARASLP